MVTKQSAGRSSGQPQEHWVVYPDANIVLGNAISMDFAQPLEDPCLALPAELFRLILSCLPARSLACACAVSASWRHAARDPLLWRDLFWKDDWEIEATDPAGPEFQDPLVLCVKSSNNTGPYQLPAIRDWATTYRRKRVMEQNWRCAVHVPFRLPQEQYPAEAHRGPVLSIRMFGRYIVTGGADGTVRLWDAVTRRLLGLPMRGDRGRVTAVDIVSRQKSGPSSNYIVSGSSDGGLIFWGMHDQRMSSIPIRAHSAQIETIRSHNSCLLTGCSKGSISVWKVNSHETEPSKVSLSHRLSLGGHNSPIAALNLVGGYASSHAFGGESKVWDLSTGECIHEVYDCRTVPLCHLDGQSLAGGVPPITRILSDDLGSDFTVLKDTPDLITSAQTLRDSKGHVRTIVSTCRSGVLAIWNKCSNGSWKIQNTLDAVPAHGRSILREILGYELNVQADEQMVVVSSRSSPVIWGWDFRPDSCSLDDSNIKVGDT